MLDRKSLVMVMPFILVGLCLGMTVASGDTVIVGLNHWSHNKTGGFLFPTNTTLDVNLSGNELLDADLSGYAGDDISWDALDNQFDVTGNGSSKWNRGSGGVLYTKVDGDDVQVNGSLKVGDIRISSNYLRDVAYMLSNENINIRSNGSIIFIPNDDVRDNTFTISDSAGNIKLSVFHVMDTPDLIFDASGDITFSDNPLKDVLTLNTGHGDNELFAMNQDVETSDNVEFVDVHATGDVTVDGETRHTENVTISGLTKNDAKNLYLRSYHKVGFDTWLASKIFFFDEAADRASIWYADSTFGAGTAQGIQLDSNTNIVLNANSGAGRIYLDGVVGLDDDIPLSFGVGSGVFRSEIFGNANGLFINPLNWGVFPGTDLPTVQFNSENLDTDFIVNTGVGESLFVNGSTGNVSVSGNVTVDGDIQLNNILFSPNAIDVKSSGDTDDYFRFSTGSVVGNVPTLDIIGSTTAYITSDQATGPYLSLVEDATHQMWFGWEKVSDLASMSCTHNFAIQTGDYDDYIQFEASENTPRITTVGNCNLNLTSSSGMIDLAGDVNVDGDVVVDGTLGMNDNNITNANTIFFNSVNATQGISPAWGYLWGMETYGNNDYTNTDSVYGNFYLPVVGDPTYYIGYGNTSKTYFALGQSGNLSTRLYQPESSLYFFDTEMTGRKAVTYKFHTLLNAPNSIFNYVHEKTSDAGNRKNIIFNFNSSEPTSSTEGSFLFNGETGGFEIDADVSVDGVTNSTGGFATDTGSGWSGTFTASEGVVTVRNGIIIDVDWD